MLSAARRCENRYNGHWRGVFWSARQAPGLARVQRRLPEDLRSLPCFSAGGNLAGARPSPLGVPLSIASQAVKLWPAGLGRFATWPRYDSDEGEVATTVGSIGWVHLPIA